MTGTAKGSAGKNVGTAIAAGMRIEIRTGIGIGVATANVGTAFK